jgi:carboxypeptidase PM20D1
MKRLFAAASIGLGLLIAVLLANTLRLPAPAALNTAAATAPKNPDAVQRLAAALRIPTISYEDRKAIDAAQFERLAAHLQQSFPRTHSQLRLEQVSGHGLLFTWVGREPQARPILLLAHQDVVPIEPGTESVWQQPPFSGAVADGYVWGRGALDDKAGVMAQLEAVEALLAEGAQPRRTIYLAFGHDEEIGGDLGAKKIAELLASRGVRAEFSLDEGGAITTGIVAGLQRPVASIMSAEKGYASFELTARGAGGHSSYPPQVTAIGQLAGAVSRLEAQQMPARLASPVTDMLLALAPELPFGQRLGIANRWLLAPVVISALEQQPVTNAFVRTTTAPTIFKAGIKDNVLPSEARAVVNFRLLPGDSIASVERHLREVIADPEIKVELAAFSSEPSPVSSLDTPAYAALSAATREVFPEALVTTGVVTGATDNRHYGAVREAAYNFLPVTLDGQDLERIHGANERIGVEAYERMIQFYISLLRKTAF